MKLYNTISEIAAKYDAFIIDLWGVIHDGNETYPRVIETLKNLRLLNKEIIFLSNAPRQAAKAKLVLDRLKITSDLYNKIVTSGEVTREYVQKSTHLGSHFFILGPDKDDDLLDGLEKYNKVFDAEKADFAIVTGFDNDDSVLADVMPILEIFKRRNLHLICANPDLFVVKKNGAKALCAGLIAQKYQEMGGKISQFGKPYKEVYLRSLDYLQHIPKSRVAAIGDNLETDIIGANNQAIDSYLISGGILSIELKIKHGEIPDKKILAELLKKYNIMPIAVLPSFIW